MAKTLALLLATIVLQALVECTAQLPTFHYERPVLAWQLLVQLFAMVGSAKSWALLVWLGLLVMLVRGRQRFFCSWRELPLGRTCWWLIAVTTLTLTWDYTTYEFNHYFGQRHLADRFLLLAFAVGTLHRPVMAIPFVVVATMILHQFHYPLSLFLSAADDSVLHVMLFFAAALLLTWVTRQDFMAAFLFLALCRVAANYWWPGAHKLRLAWFLHPYPHLMVPCAYAHGWLATVAPSSIAAGVEALAKIAPVTTAGVLIAECAGLAALVHRRATIGLLAIWIVLHVSIFLAVGYFFWKWIAVNISLIVVLVAYRRESECIFGKTYACMSVLLIGACFVWSAPAALAWYDTPLSDSYRLQATDENGEEFWLRASFFGPYDDQFTMASFAFLHDAAHVVQPYGATWQRDAASELVKASSPAEILAIEKRYGFASFDAEKTAAFDELVRRFARPEFAKSGSPLVRAVAAPPLFWNFQSGRFSPGRSPIERVDVYRLTRWYHRGKIKTIRNVLVHTIQINPPNLEGPSSI